MTSIFERSRVEDGHLKEWHRTVKDGGARAAVFGISDGLVTNVSLIVGMVGAHPVASIIRLAGLAGLVAGACSMAIGEYISMQAQRELLQKEIEKERLEIERFPEEEHQELVDIYRSRGLAPDLAYEVATAMMSGEGAALETHVREELGISTGDLGSPLLAASASFGSFALGAAVPLLPWFVAQGTPAAVATVVLAALMAVAVGTALSRFTGRSPVRSAARQLVLSVAATGIAFGIGSAIGSSRIR
ncbi:MAG: VIT1/CCC1 transporter family protein [Actinobacteria bacterium]|nr:VIT1/CCC1 transporter family protein [Actinomycetota bacterium]MCL5446509.1 VIT1/CCC1 transporter family protein [Actinomycetota bacterium]